MNNLLNLLHKTHDLWGLIFLKVIKISLNDSLIPTNIFICIGQESNYELND
jgi:hypothetical protein